ncbi:MAG: hypothetical protein JKY37_25510 [Nannocystaceae bacterium]|nr:hypothetical protein [Nannocystaceae bacterium]
MSLSRSPSIRLSLRARLAAGAAACAGALLVASVATAAPGDAPGDPSASAPKDGEASNADGTVNVLVLRVGGTGSASSAQTYIDALMAVTARVNGWAAAHGKYFTSPRLARTWVTDAKPEYGILSLQAYLALRESLGLSLLGTVDAVAAGGQQYFLISVNQHDLAGCKGKTLATHLGKDTKFVDNVVAGEAFSLADFEVVDTRRPVKTLKTLLRGEAECAFVDDAQMTALSKLEGADTAQTVWFSATFPSLIVAKFARTADADAKTFAGNLDKVCEGDGAKACGGAGIEKLAETPAEALDKLTAKYDG